MSEDEKNIENSKNDIIIVCGEKIIANIFLSDEFLKEQESIEDFLIGCNKKHNEEEPPEGIPTHYKIYIEVQKQEDEESCLGAKAIIDIHNGEKYYDCPSKPNEKWATYEANLQSYRSLLISLQTVMLAVAAIMADKSLLVTAAISVLAVIIIFFIWMPIIEARGVLVDYYKFDFGKIFNTDGEYVGFQYKEKRLTSEDYLKKRAVREKVNKLVPNIYEGVKNPFTNKRRTRKKLDIILPLSLVILWVAMLFYSWIEHR